MARDVFKNFAERKINRKHGDASWSRSDGRVFCDDRTLFSFGRHFPLARYLGEVDGRHVFLKNGDPSTPSTGNHQGQTQSVCSGPTVSFSGLTAAGLNSDRVELDNLVDWVADSARFRQLYRNELGIFEDAECTQPFKVPDMGRWVPDTYHNPETEAENWREGYETAAWRLKDRPEWATEPMLKSWVEIVEKGPIPNIAWTSMGTWHVLGAVLLKHNDRHLLCSLDEGSYFVSELPQAASSVKEAFEILKPEAVKAAESVGLEVKRQGEWFAIPTGMDDEAMRNLLASSLPTPVPTKQIALPGMTRKKRTPKGLTLAAFRKLLKTAKLPVQNEESNGHWIKHVEVSGVLYGRGKMFHRLAEPVTISRWGQDGLTDRTPEVPQLSREHRALDLRGEWHILERNTERVAYKPALAATGWGGGRGRYD